MHETMYYNSNTIYPSLFGRDGQIYKELPKLLAYAFNEQLEELSKLLDNEIDLDQKNEHGSSALHFAAYEDNSQIVPLLLAKKLPVDIQNKDGATPLHFGVRHGSHDTVSLLIMYGADVNKQDINGTSALHLAALYGHLEIVILLLKMGADPNIVDKQLNNPLHAAANQENDLIVEILINHGASIDHLNNQGDNPADICLRTENLAPLEILLLAGCHPGLSIQDSALNDIYTNLKNTPLITNAAKIDLLFKENLTEDEVATIKNYVEEFKTSDLDKGLISCRLLFNLKQHVNNLNDAVTIQKWMNIIGDNIQIIKNKILNTNESIEKTILPLTFLAALTINHHKAEFEKEKLPDSVLDLLKHTDVPLLNGSLCEYKIELNNKIGALLGHTTIESNYDSFENDS